MPGRSWADGRRRSATVTPASSSTTASTCSSAAIGRRWHSCNSCTQKIACGRRTSLELVCYDRDAPAIRSALPAAPGSAPPSCRRPQVAADPAEGPAERAASRPADSSGAAPAADVTDGLRRSARAHGAAVARSSPPGCDAPGVAVASARRRRPESAARRRGSRRIRAHPRRHVRTGSVGSGRRPAALPAARDVCRAGARFHHRPRWRSPDVGADARKRQQRASGRRRGARRAAHRGRRDRCCALVRPARALRRLAAPRAAGRARRGRRHGGDADRDGEPLVRPARHAGSLRGTAGADDAVGVRQADRVRRERLAPVAGLERRYRDRRDDQRGTRRRSRRGRSKRRCRGRAVCGRFAQPSCGRSRRRSRWRPVSRGVPARGRPSRICSSPATGPTPVCLRRSKGRWSAGIGRRPQWWSRVSNCTTVRPPKSSQEITRQKSPGASCGTPDLLRMPWSVEVAIWQIAVAESGVNAVRHRPLPGNRPQRKEPPVVRGAAGAQPARGDCRTST